MLFLELWNAPIDRIAIENPIGIMSTRLQKPSQIIQPHNYGAPVRKATCLWLKNLPPLLSFDNQPHDAIKIGKHGKSMSRWYMSCRGKDKNHSHLRSKTFSGIANAMAEQWG